MIQKLSLKNFSRFENLQIDFSPKINIILGENGTGKTQLLKAGYAICNGSKLFKGKENPDQENIETELAKLFVELFLPSDDKLDKIKKRGSAEAANLEILFRNQEKELSFSFNKNSKKISIDNLSGYSKYTFQPTFIPVKEVLSFMRGFVSLYEKRELFFDSSYKDLCSTLDLPSLKELQPKSKWAKEEIRKICGGNFRFDGGGKITFQSDSGEEFSIHSIAEGFLKLGILSRLLETGALKPGASGPLFWDEPETNLNPKLMKLLVQVLLELSRNGQQIILTTHDYVLLKWFGLLSDSKKDDHVLYHNLYADKDTKEIKIISSDDFSKLNSNAIDDAYASLIDKEIENEMGGLGK